METKSIKNPSKLFPKPTRAPRSILDGQNGTKQIQNGAIQNLCKIDAKINAEKVSENEAKMNQNRCRNGAKTVTKSMLFEK